MSASAKLARVGLLAVASLLPAAVLIAQDEEALTRAANESLERQERAAALEDIVDSIAAVQSEIQEKERELARARSEEEKSSAADDLEARRIRFADLESDFTSIATGLDPGLFDPVEQEHLDWREELGVIFSPILLEIRAAAANPREIEHLRSEVALYERRLPEIEAALAQIAGLAEETQSSAIKSRLSELEEYWLGQKAEQAAQFEATRLRFEQKVSEKTTFRDAVQDILRIFFRRRGRNLILALTAFLGILFLLRWFHRYIHSTFERLGSRQFLIRLVDVVYYLATLTAAVGALLVVLYLSGDWVLLALAVFFLLGLAWAAKNALPAFFEQAKLMLNLGAVREGERLVYRDVPWKVSSLNIFTDLENPELTGGRLRLPLKDLIDLRSRPFDKSQERWFPSRVGDWVIMADGTYGKVVLQTPEEVVVDTLRGSHKAYRTPDYLDHRPRNLSINDFSVNHVLRIDFKHRNEALTGIPEKVKALLEETLKREEYGDCLQRVIVELKEIGEWALEFITIARFSGGAASEYTEIGWKLQQVAVDACNRYGWEIPYRQIEVHGSDSP